jgi:hypothetical protein
MPAVTRRRPRTFDFKKPSDAPLGFTDLFALCQVIVALGAWYFFQLFEQACPGFNKRHGTFLQLSRGIDCLPAHLTSLPEYDTPAGLPATAEEVVASYDSMAADIRRRAANEIRAHRLQAMRVLRTSKTRIQRPHSWMKP